MEGMDFFPSLKYLNSQQDILLFKFNGSTRNNLVQGKAGVENSAGKQEAKL